MKKIVLSFLALASGIAFASAQKLEDGIQALYYGKFTSAEQTFQQVVQKNPQDGQSIYWLGQVYLENKNGETDGTGKALDLYQKAANLNSPWILVGLGEIDYINHKNDAAEQKFEQAITLADKIKGRHKEVDQAAIRTAIGRASAYGDKDLGDPAYAIPKLQEAMNLDKTDPNSALYLGLNFLKLGGDQGGNAYSAFTQASNRDPKFAAADYHLGLIFQSQDNFDVMNQWYQTGITADPTFAPIYLGYFNYYKDKDVNKAKEYLDKYVANSDNGCEVQYYQADYLFQTGSYQESINKAKQMEAGSCATYSHLPLLMAADYHRLGDTTQAVTYAKKFFTTVAPGNIQPYDYAFAGFIYKDIPEMADTAVTYLTKAYDMDTLASDKAMYADSISYALDKANKPIAKYDWLRKLYNAKDTASRTNLDIFNLGQAALEAGKVNKVYLPTADTMFTLYKTKYPKQAYGYYYLEQTKLAEDTSTIVQAIPAINDYINFLSKDTVKNKELIIAEYGKLGSYYVYDVKDYAKGLEIFQKIANLDPTNDAAKSAVDQLQKAVEQQKQLEEYYQKHPEKRPKDSTK